MSDEQAIVSPEAVEVSEDASAIDNNVAAETSVAPEKQPAEENVKHFSQDQVNIISNDVKRKTEARIRAEYEARLNAANTADQQSSERHYEQDEMVQRPSQEAYTEEQRYQLFKRRQQQEYEDQTRLAVANDIKSKLVAAGNFDKLESSGLGQISSDHPLVSMLNSLDNLPDVVNEFDADITKLTTILNATNIKPQKGIQKLIALSQSIKRNKEALSREKAPEPLSQIKPSSYGLGGGEESISDIRKLPSLRF